ncbi:platelet endothelial aggregation receptor 1-like [Gigantopelta aegis]|uniref:platelet endothelial aggregation receptor 1-like n=1 Tax=Gigantopelta aegis TaxID=1735272 RepID=UPI001B889162|nr:platelet endothelial aggregation receptor 1-like [Gigantopelta aegis]
MALLVTRSAATATVPYNHHHVTCRQETVTVGHVSKGGQELTAQQLQQYVKRVSLTVQTVPSYAPTDTVLTLYLHAILRLGLVMGVCVNLDGRELTVHKHVHRETTMELTVTGTAETDTVFLHLNPAIQSQETVVLRDVHLAGRETTVHNTTGFTNVSPPRYVGCAGPVYRNHYSPEHVSNSHHSCSAFMFRQSGTVCKPTTSGHVDLRGDISYRTPSSTPSEMDTMTDLVDKDTDESRFNLKVADGRIRVNCRRGVRHQECCVMEVDRYGGGSVMVWAGIFCRGVTDFHVIDQNLTGRNPCSRSNCIHGTASTHDVPTRQRSTACDQSCSGGTYGSACSLQCSARHCEGDSTCDHITGGCVNGCRAGWTSTDCTTACSNGNYGLKCTKYCNRRHCLSSSSCNKQTGACDAGGCIAGWMGVDCAQACVQGVTYGSNCIKSCAARHCDSRYTSQCPADTGKCSRGCDPRWNGDDCTQACIKGNNYGANCNKNCRDRHCVSSSAPCSTDTGDCGTKGCSPGWTGVDCTQQCSFGKYGERCLQECIDRHCYGGQRCDPVTGQCVDGCIAGWQGVSCSEVKTTDLTTVSPQKDSESTIVALSTVIGVLILFVIIQVIVNIRLVLVLRRSRGSSGPSVSFSNKPYNSGNQSRKTTTPSSVYEAADGETNVLECSCIFGKTQPVPPPPPPPPYKNGSPYAYGAKNAYFVV